MMGRPSVTPLPPHVAPFSINPLLLVFVVFVVSRLVMLPYIPDYTDVGLYGKYAYEFRRASQIGISFYEFHRLGVERRMDEWRRKGHDAYAQELRSLLLVEYPPLAVAVMIGPALLVPAHAANDEVQVPKLYVYVFRSVMILVDCLLFLFVWILARRLFPGESSATLCLRLAVFGVLGAALWPVYLDRLDLLMSLLVSTSLLLLFNQRSYFWSFLVLALAINYKLIPIVVSPVWIIGSLPASDLARVRRAGDLVSLLPALLARCALLVLIVIGLFLPFYWWGGPPTLDFLTYHRDRPIEIGSAWTPVLLLLRALGHDLDFSRDYGGLNVISDLAPLIMKLSTVLLVCGAVFATVLLLRALHRCAVMEASVGATLANQCPRVCCAFTLLFFALAICVSKVFTAQYLVFLIPLVALLPFPLRITSVLVLLCLGCAILTTLMFPVFWGSDIFRLSEELDKPQGPVTFGTLLLTMRVVLFVIFTAILAYCLARRMPANPQPVAEV
jgi:hypothetical protein